MTRPTAFWFIPALLLITTAGWTEPTTVQRELFRAADAALAAGNRAPLLASRSVLHNYPLYPYLLYRDLNQRLDGFPTEEVRGFLNDHPDLPVSRRLRNAWLSRLAEAGRWDDFLTDYRDSGNITLECHRRTALLARGRTDAALDGIESVWLHGYSRPDACDPAFAVWRARGGLTPALIWQRFERAMQAGQDGLGRYLSRLLPDARRPAAERWLQVESDPTRVLSERFDPSDAYTPAILHHGLWRWSSRDSVTAAAAHDTLRQRYELPDNADWDALQRRLALFVASRGHPDARRRLDELPARLVDESVEEWRVRVALQNRDWSAALGQLQRMSAAIAARPQWRYWRARALEATGRREDAEALFRELAELRDYHGFLAADRLDRPYRILHQPVTVPDQQLGDLAAESGIVRARELYRLQRPAEARIEWEQALSGADPARLRAAARLADDWGWHDRAIIALGRTGDWDDLELRFPLPYRDDVVVQARARGIDPAWVYAVARQESLFQTDARSGAGALGLMQILPGTGRTIAGELGVDWSGSYGLLQPATNLRFGTYYLRRSLERLQQHPMLATAAYNAGPHRVVDWLPARESIPADIWAEIIPFHETRDYVKRVMEYAVVYGWRLGDMPRRLSARLRPIVPAG